jgi:hypothetical protein
MNFATPRSVCAAIAVSLFAAALLVVAGIAVAEDGQPASGGATETAPPPPAASPAPPAANKPGFLHELWQWWDNSISGLGAQMQDAMKSTAEATKGAASTLLRLPNTRLIEIRERCAPAPNGAPDCQTAAANACRGKGFNTGQPLDVVSAEKCPPAALLSTQKPGELDCPIETVVSRAVCQ